MEEIEVPIRRIRPGGSGDAVPFPSYRSAGSAGMGLYADLERDLLLPPLERCLIPTGIAVALPDGFEAQIRPRSGMALKHGITLLNSPGTIDSDYRGEIQIIAINLGKEPFVVRRGDRVAQLVVQRVSRARWQVVDELPASGRQEGGFGHTDKKN